MRLSLSQVRHFSLLLVTASLVLLCSIPEGAEGKGHPVGVDVHTELGLSAGAKAVVENNSTKEKHATRSRINEPQFVLAQLVAAQYRARACLPWTDNADTGLSVGRWHFLGGSPRLIGTHDVDRRPDVLSGASSRVLNLSRQLNPLSGRNDQATHFLDGQPRPVGVLVGLPRQFQGFLGESLTCGARFFIGAIGYLRFVESLMEGR